MAGPQDPQNSGTPPGPAPTPAAPPPGANGTAGAGATGAASGSASTDTGTNGVSPIIELHGHRYDPRTMTPAQAAEARRLLPPPYQRQAEAYTDLAQHFERVLDIQLPSGMSLSAAVENTKAATAAN